MSSQVFSFLETDDLSLPEIEGLFAQAKNIKKDFLTHRHFLSSTFACSSENKLLSSLLFFEPSTRTRSSFEMAALRMGWQSSFFDGASKEGSSLIKGETFEDTFWTLHAMGPNVLVVRCGDELPLFQLRKKTQIPLINAGCGTHSHPTQALLDVFTMRESFPDLIGKNILFVGDVSHSRVAKSHFRLLPKLGAQVGVVGPEAFLKQNPADVKSFADLKEALPWADVVVGLRVQFERHSEPSAFTREAYIEKFQIKSTHANLLKSSALLFHPGPVNWGLEFDPSVRELPHFKMWQQKQNGVYVRAALLDFVAKKNGY
jgi:aspartate carbamoyltransferase catalytic subunit